MKLSPEKMRSIENVISEIANPRHKADYDADFWWYFRSSYDANGENFLPGSVDRLLEEFIGDLNLAKFDPVGKITLDAGCGYGIMVLLMGLLGAKESHGIDTDEPMVQTFRKYLSYFPELKNIYPLQGNVIDTSYPDQHFDFVLSNEAISHYYDIPGFLRETYRILKKGGILFISDANNGANPYIAWRTKKLWDRFENGPKGQVFYSTVTEPYIETRASIIREHFSDLSEQEIQTLSKGSFGYTRQQIIKACQNYHQTGVSPNSYFKYGETPVDPAKDDFQERLIFPRDLSKQLAEIGFRTKIFAHLGGAGGNKVVQALNKVVENTSPISWPVGRALKIVAVKR